MHESMFYKVNVLTEFKQDTTDFVSDSETIPCRLTASGYFWYIV